MNKILTNSILFVFLLINIQDINSQNTNNVHNSAPSITYKNPDNGTPSALILRKIAISVQIVGNIANTTMDMTFYNEINRQLEGELVFPLGEGQTVSAFAMEMNGNLRSGVVVEKQKGQKVFESIVRRRIDPALLEWTPGNNFKARVYPILAQGTKRIVISYEQELDFANNNYSYKLPLDYNLPIQDFSLNISVNTQNQAPAIEGKDWGKLKFKKEDVLYKAQLTEKNYLPSSAFAINIPTKETKNAWYVDKGKNDLLNYFYISTFQEQHIVDKKLPNKICIFWDASSSGVKRNLAKELSLLESYISVLKNVNVQLITFSNSIDSISNFEIKNSNYSALSTYIKNITYDGATQLGILDFSQFSCDEILLFSDGVSNFGKHEILLSKTPVIAINSSLTAEHAYLNNVTSSTLGVYLNLEKISESQALEKMSKQNLSFISAEFNSNEISEVYPSKPFVCNGNLTVAGKLNTEKAIVKLNFGYGKEIVKTEVLELIADSATHSGIIERVWVQKKIKELQSDFKNKDAEITELGKKYSVVTRNTSLIVLDLMSDYVQYEIVPPVEMQKEYFELLKNKKQIALQNTDNQIKNVLELYNQKASWWNGKIIGNNVNRLDIEISDVEFNSSSEPLSESSSNQNIESTIRFTPPEIRSDEEISLNNTRTLTGQASGRLLRGTITDAQTGEAIPFASVISLANNTGTTTDFDGNYSLQIPENTEMAISFVGYESIAVNTSNKTTLNITLNATSVTMEELTIADYSAPLIDSDGASIEVMEKSQISKMSSSSVDAIISTMGGVFSQDANGNLNIRGARSNANAIFIDGVRVDDLRNIPKNTIEQIIVYNGGIPARYGDVTGGVIEIKTKGFYLRRTQEPIFVRSTNDNKGSSVYQAPEKTKWMKELEETNPSELYQKYLELKTKYADSPAFYREVSDLLIEKNQKTLGVKVLSNIVELELSNHELMRIVARRLQQIGEVKDAILLFKDILKLRPEEPHSFRDLGLAYADNEQNQEAVDILYELIMKNWDNRFPGIETVVLGEMNSIINSSKSELDVSKIDKRLLKNLPVEIRVVLNWDANNTDVDLWVTEPNNEKCMYSNRFTQSGGYLSNDYTGGYGPEEYLIRDAKKGKYQIQINYYGNSRQDTKRVVTVQVQIFTNYGTPLQNKKEYTVMMTNNRDVVDIGELIYK